LLQAAADDLELGCTERRDLVDDYKLHMFQQLNRLVQSLASQIFCGGVRVRVKNAVYSTGAVAQVGRRHAREGYGKHRMEGAKRLAGFLNRELGRVRLARAGCAQ
jgi:hypothetical protein